MGYPLQYFLGQCLNYPRYEQFSTKNIVQLPPTYISHTVCSSPFLIFLQSNPKPPPPPPPRWTDVRQRHQGHIAATSLHHKANDPWPPLTAYTAHASICLLIVYGCYTVYVKSKVYDLLHKYIIVKIECCLFDIYFAT